MVYFQYFPLLRGIVGNQKTSYIVPLSMHTAELAVYRLERKGTLEEELKTRHSTQLCI